MSDFAVSGNVTGIASGQKSKRGGRRPGAGRKKTGASVLKLRLPPDALKAIDAYRADHGPEKGRAVAAREILTIGLRYLATSHLITVDEEPT